MNTAGRSAGGVFMRSPGGVRGRSITPGAITFTCAIAYDWSIPNPVPYSDYYTEGLYNLSMPDGDGFPGAAYSLYSYYLDIGILLGDYKGVPSGWRYIWVLASEVDVYPYDTEERTITVILPSTSGSGHTLIDKEFLIASYYPGFIKAVHHSERANYVDINGVVTSYNATLPYKLDNAELRITASADISLNVNGSVYALVGGIEQSIPLSVTYDDYENTEWIVRNNVSWSGVGWRGDGVLNTFVYSEYRGFMVEITTV